jgi:hypothetical protein
LKRILRIMLVRQDMAANAPDQPAVPVQQCGECFSVPVGGVIVEQLRVGPLDQGQSMQLTQNRARMGRSHGAIPPDTTLL